MAMLKLAPPWVTYASELAQLFKYDPEVHVVYDDYESEVRLYVDNGAKASAIEALLPETKEYGNVTLRITVVPANEFTAPTGNLYQTAFSGNGAFAFVKQISGIFSNNLTYVVFKNKVVQYFNDDIGDIYGQCSTLYQDIAKDVFTSKEGVFFCTDVEEPVYEDGLKYSAGAPLGDWP